MIKIFHERQNVFLLGKGPEDNKKMIQQKKKYFEGRTFILIFF